MLDLFNTPVPKRLARPHQTIRSVRVPSDLVLTPRVLLGAIQTLRTTDIQWVVDVLIDELNIRAGDPDLESEADEASEPDDENR